MPNPQIDYQNINIIAPYPKPIIIVHMHSYCLILVIWKSFCSYCISSKIDINNKCAVADTAAKISLLYFSQPCIDSWQNSWIGDCFIFVCYVMHNVLCSMWASSHKIMFFIFLCLHFLKDFNPHNYTLWCQNMWKTFALRGPMLLSFCRYIYI